MTNYFYEFHHITSGNGHEGSYGLCVSIYTGLSSITDIIDLTRLCMEYNIYADFRHSSHYVSIIPYRGK